MKVRKRKTQEWISSQLKCTIVLKTTIICQTRKLCSGTSQNTTNLKVKTLGTLFLSLFTLTMESTILNSRSSMNITTKCKIKSKTTNMFLNQDKLRKINVSRNEESEDSQNDSMRVKKVNQLKNPLLQRTCTSSNLEKTRIEATVSSCVTQCKKLEEWSSQEPLIKNRISMSKIRSKMRRKGLSSSKGISTDLCWSIGESLISEATGCSQASMVFRKDISMKMGI